MDPQKQTQESQGEKANPLLIPISIILSGALIGAGLYLSSRPSASEVRSSGNNSVVDDINVPSIKSDDHVFGNPRAEVVIIEYSDTECPFCKTFHATLKRIVNDYGKDGKVAWVYRHFPIAQLHSRAGKEAEATECAAELGGNSKFWEFTDAVFARTPSNNGLNPAELPKIAEDIGLNVNKFESCLSSGKYAKKVQDQYNEAIVGGGNGTPFSVVFAKDGQKIAVKGAQPYEVLKTIIEASLNPTLPVAP
ncbi:MAG: hypothetical protein CO184_00200 [Candidatus Zambryskibacteria bacterium CG_4_9_14_3_um_filter_40_16]|uniref:Thioredoxin domain-containing protein n=2 Tax=Candidatus Zambryskiibacteriota TaxID=1817925 RepID=A0A2H0K686_9BACT|nr:MAG: hypothetical protein COV95_02435 [Candidatus Zambryskibacteria bacterium CG11_big_fil_rev_8_21_14_0_20_40_24]PJA34375.1 MAG: hypothetical protein CO184_00200 [Candidatus Zambryskibacteria bacterium CG_4_9_14_3_um_filter_40_16]